MMQKLSKKEKLERLVGKEILVEEIIADGAIYAKGILIRRDDARVPGYYLSGAFNRQIPMKAIIRFSRTPFVGGHRKSFSSMPTLILDFEEYANKQMVNPGQNEF